LKLSIQKINELKKAFLFKILTWIERKIMRSNAFNSK
jgi:hypothetical protein